MRKLIAKIKKTNPVMLWRYALLAFILIMVTVLGRLHQLDQRTFPSVDALCPFGGLESLYSLLFQGKFLERVFSSSLILLITTGLLALVAGRAFCGWLCPLGALQGIMHAMAKVFKRKQQPLLLNQDKYLRWAKYPVLIFFTAGAWIGGKMLIREFEPWVAYMHISELDRIFQEFPVGITLLLAILLTSLFISRPFCRYLCPMGALLGLVSRISLFRIRREEQACSKCTTTCPVGIDVARGSLGRGASLGQDTSSQGTSVPLSECLACGECVTACSKQAS
jgi:polyferredoxin